MCHVIDTGPFIASIEMEQEKAIPGYPLEASPSNTANLGL